MTSKRNVGRPPRGEDGARVRDYPQLSIRVPAVSKQKLKALSVVRGQPQWRVLADSVECYVRELPNHERARVDRLTRISAP